MEGHVPLSERKTITASMKERETTDVATNRSDYVLIMKNSSN